MKIYNIINKTVLIFSILPVLCLGQINKKDYEMPFRDPDLAINLRVNDLIHRLTIEEKISQMQNNAPAINRLGIPGYNWWNECLHGVGRSGHKVTVFPQAIAMAATFNPQAIEREGDIIANEARGIYNKAVAEGKGINQYQGITFWSPNINIFRDPRWGRGQETYGEDPYLTSAIAQSFVKGLQGNDSLRLKTSACAKHYAVHSGPEFGRHTFDVTVSTYDLWDTYLPAFQDLVLKSKVSGVMCAYNRYQGQPCCGNDLLMNDILRKKWGFSGYVTSDCGAIDDFYKNHKTHVDKASAAADAVLHGTDLDCGTEAYTSLVDAVKKGLISEADIDNSLRRLFTLRFRLGMFDPIEKDPYSKIPYSILEAPSHKQHALQLARESIVLLKNKNQILPLKSSVKKILIIGPNANDEEVQLGNYNGIPSQIITPLLGMNNCSKQEIIYMDGLSRTEKADNSLIEKIVKAAKKVDVVIYVGGISPKLEGEEGDAGKELLDGFKGGDRTTIALPKAQTDVMKQVKSIGTPIIFICMSGSAISFEWEANNADAILQAWYGGQAAGTAIADILFGKYNPSARLPITFYKNDSDLPDFENYSMSNRTYKYFTKTPLYPFGFGLSYTSFTYKWKQKPRNSYTIKDTFLECRFITRNVGKYDGEEVAQAYIHYPQKGMQRLPIKELRYFKKSAIRKNKEVEFHIRIPINHLQKWNEKLGIIEVPKGRYNISIGSHSNDKQIEAAFYIN